MSLAFGPDICGIHLGMTKEELKDVGFILDYDLIDGKDNSSCFGGYFDYVMKFEFTNDRVSEITIKICKELCQNNNEFNVDEFILNFTNMYFKDYRFECGRFNPHIFVYNDDSNFYISIDKDENIIKLVYRSKKYII